MTMHPTGRRVRQGSGTGGDLVAHWSKPTTNGRSGAFAAPLARRSPPPRRYMGPESVARITDTHNVRLWFGLEVGPAPFPVQQFV